ncbi:hypothetical protein HMPREF0549_0406 [Limosilactobacillus vaginalis DSM 5837 = ATCC 49540]|uniref:Uncharacterized protein n=2 Tax=Limosilactobacillus vaginalis TaxID=1633 RepID=C2ESH0_9LACO|nr:hypothetical protein HMPREF0549_0406 [Limosilactobacillus vaginalis DSM 5837 = ATCC 49540]
MLINYETAKLNLASCLKEFKNMAHIYLMTLIIIFMIESFFEVKWFAQIRDIFQRSGRITPTKRVQRVIKIETQWSWFSWILLILLFVLPEVYTFLLICIITLIETIIVYELYNARNYAQQINK